MQIFIKDVDFILIQLYSDFEVIFMTLKEIRLMKNRTQEECAKYLGVSLRTYNSYENDVNKVTSIKYQSMCNKLNDYGMRTNLLRESISIYNDFYTNVVINDELKMLIDSIKGYKKRDCFEELSKFTFGEFLGKICILYGLRRTGKTTLLFQMMQDLPLEEVCYIKIKTTDTMSHLTKDLSELNRLGYKYIFIDEITLLNEFIDTAAILSDIYASMGMKIVLSGTDSLGFLMAKRDELYDRCITIHTSFISYKEYERLLGIHSIDTYIEYAGTLKIENMSYEDPDSIFDDVSFRDDESTRKYIDSFISRNIQHTLKNDHDGEYFNQLRELYECGELTNVINRIVEDMNHHFVLKVIEDEFKSHDLGSTKNLLLHEVPKKTATILEEIDTKKLSERLKKIIEIKEKNELSIKVTNDHIEKIKKYLIMLDLVMNCPDVYESGSQEDHYIFTQPGLRYSITKALVYSLMQDKFFQSNSEVDKQHIINKILEDVKGRMLEDIVLLETTKVINKTKKAFKFKFDIGGEYDMVIYDTIKNNCTLFEIKHNNKDVPIQYRYLIDPEKNAIIEHKYGKIENRIVLYRGENKILSNGIQYKNVEEYLKEIKIL